MTCPTCGRRMRCVDSREHVERRIRLRLYVCERDGEVGTVERLAVDVAAVRRLLGRLDRVTRKRRTLHVGCAGA